MFNNRNKINFVTICYWLSILCLSAKSNVKALSIQKAHASENDVGHNEFVGSSSINGGGNGNGNGNALQSDATARNFSPRLEYNNEWRPVGRGDPLKNDPTYDYSPPALERVRYWRAENESRQETNNPTKHQKKDYAVSNKKEILLLGIPSERHRGQTLHGEPSPVLQSKYPPIRRSYYAHQHQLPTHLMPPPMQTLSPAAHMMKNSAAIEYRHNMPSSTTKTTTTTATAMGMMHTKPYSPTPWIASMPTSGSMSPMMHRKTSNMPHMHMNHGHHYQESINQFSYSRPTSFTPNNFIETNHNSLKTRKPWLHELLQKEVVKVQPKPMAHKYSSTYEPISSSMAASVSTTYPPVSFVPLPSSTTPQTTAPTSTTTTTTTHIYTATSPVYFTTTAPAAATTTTQKIKFVNSPPTAPPPPTPTGNRLLIPSTSNLMHRPTVTPIEMTTDPLFKHYKQPAQPLLGPMYLIIEGHSKVKTYGKDELDPHQPKIVPIIPKREPVVRMADPNDKPDTTMSLQVKHLHTKATTPTDGATTTTTTTNAPKLKETSTAKPTNPSTTKTTTTITTATKSNDQRNDAITKLNTQLPATEPPTGMGGFFDFLDSSLGNLFIDGPTGAEIGEVGERYSPQKTTIRPITTQSVTKANPAATKTTTTTATKPTQIEARIGTHAGSIESLIDFEEEELNDEKIITEPVPRDVRQVFDYDQLPESRLKDRKDVNSAQNDNDDDNDESSVDLDDGVMALHNASDEGIDLEDVESLSPEEYDDASHELIKRIDNLVDGIDDNETADLEELISAEVDDADDEDIEMRRAKEV